jgi:hypothetical protein
MPEAVAERVVEPAVLVVVNVAKAVDVSRKIVTVCCTLPALWSDEKRETKISEGAAEGAPLEES